jgi:hypothetical protein
LGGGTVVVQQRVQHGAVFEGGVHALAMERDDCVRGVAQEQDTAADVPGGQVDCA